VETSELTEIMKFSPATLFPFIGMGGTERWIAYQIILWLTGFGSYFMHKTYI
jgi:hypothetical protein